MSVKHIYIVIIAIVAMFYSSVSNAQHYIGFIGGYGVGTFTNFTKKQDYNANYHFKSGVNFSSFYETKIDSGFNLRVELQYKWQNADMKIDYNAGHSSFYNNTDYSFHLLNINLICLFRLIEKKLIKMNLLFGPTLAYNINTIAKGNESGYYYETQIDTNGNSMPFLTTRNWEKNEHNSKELSKFNFGIDLGLDFIIHISNKMDFIFQNRYNIFLTNIMKSKNLRYTSLFTGYLNIGFRYKLDK